MVFVSMLFFDRAPRVVVPVVCPVVQCGGMA
jgi:hypothetical protein